MAIPTGRFAVLARISLLRKATGSGMVVHAARLDFVPGQVYQTMAAMTG